MPRIVGAVKIADVMSPLPEQGTCIDETRTDGKGGLRNGVTNPLALSGQMFSCKRGWGARFFPEGVSNSIS